jgi:hypothetical protein
MISFSQIANPPMPAYRPICGICEGRSVVPVPKTMSLEKCTACNGTGKEIISSTALEAQ